MSRMILTIILASASILALWAFLPVARVTQIEPFSNRVILIRHGEKGPQFTGSQHIDGPHERGHPPGPPPGRGGGRKKFPSGLNDDGRKRAQYLRQLFGNESEYDIGMIFAAPRDLPIETERTYATVAPLAEDLGLKVHIDCADTGASCVARQVEAFARQSDRDVLIAWKHRDLNGIATALGARNARKTYPDERYDVIWIFQDGAITEKRSMHCPGLDDDRVDDGDPDLEVEGENSLSWIGLMSGIWRRLVTAW